MCELTEHSTQPHSPPASRLAGTPALLLAGDTEGPGTITPLVPIGDRLDVGRRKGAGAGHLQLDGRLVSREHARLLRVDGQLFVQDLDSRNGTAVDGRPVLSGLVPLHEGSVLFIGEYTLVFRTVTEEGRRALAHEREQPLVGFATRSPRVAQLSDRLRLLAASSEALLTGETGVGKEVYARAMHGCSARRGPFLAVNCAALPRDLVESELFGYVKGAHSQAQATKRGLIQEASEGTLFLDELGEMPPEVQAKLLRFLQTREFIPLGSTRTQRVETRVIAATNRARDDGAIRPDLRHRLGESLHIPPLRRRKEDIPSLVATFLRPHPRKLSVNALQALMLYAWPGNVRELENTIARAVLLSVGQEVIELHHLPGCIGGHLSISDDSGPQDGGGEIEPAAADASLSPALSRKPRSRVTREELVQLLVQHQGRIADVARVLDRRWQVVWKWLKADGIDPNAYRDPLRNRRGLES